jgi:hypothetical protein
MQEITVEQMQKALENATSGNWTGFSNRPFYSVIRKPGPSLSKHDDTRDTYWRCEDVEFVLLCKNGGVQVLLDHIKFLQRELEDSRKEVRESGAW